MTNQQELEKNSRLLYYKLYNYHPKLEDILNGLEYEYAAVSFKRKITSDAYCTESQVWKKGKCGTAFGIAKKEHLVEAIKENKVRVKSKITTSDIKEALNKVPLILKLDDLTLTVIGRNRGLTPLLYINGVNENVLRAFPNTKLYKKWFSKETGLKRIEAELNHLLFKTNVHPVNDNLYKYVIGGYTGKIETLDKVTQNFVKDQKMEDIKISPYLNMLQDEIKNNHLITYSIEDFNEFLGVIRNKPVSLTGKHKKFKPWSEKSDAKLNQFNFSKKTKKKKQKSNSFVYIERALGKNKQYHKVNENKISAFLKNGWILTTKEKYDTKENGIFKEPKLNVTQPPHRTVKRMKIHPNKGKGVPNGAIQKVHKILDKKGKLVGIKTSLVDPQGYLLDKKGGRVFEKIVRASFVPTFVMVESTKTKINRRVFSGYEEYSYSYNRPIRVKVHTITVSQQKKKYRK